MRQRSGGQSASGLLCRPVPVPHQLIPRRQAPGPQQRTNVNQPNAALRPKQPVLEVFEEGLHLMVSESLYEAQIAPMVEFDRGG